MPDAKNDVAMVNDDIKNNIIDVLANDVDPEGGKLTVTKVTQGTSGTVTIGADGANVTYTPQPGLLRQRHLHLHDHRSGRRHRHRHSAGDGDRLPSRL